MVCLDLAHSKILLTTWKEMSKKNFLAVFPTAKAGRLVNNLDDGEKFNWFSIAKNELKPIWFKFKWNLADRNINNLIYPKTTKEIRRLSLLTVQMKKVVFNSHKVLYHEPILKF